MDSQPQDDGNKPRRLRKLVYGIIIAAAMVVTGRRAHDYFGSSPGSREVRARRNQLAVGPTAKVHSTLDLEIAPPVEFDFKRRREILDMRKEAVGRHLELVLGEYEPSEAVFGQIADGATWWGIADEYFHDQGWTSKPDSAATAPDMTCEIHFR